jgi:hypothetical protein
VSRRAAPLARMKAFIDVHGMTHTYRTLMSGRRWALILIRREDTLRAADWTREPGE